MRNDLCKKELPSINELLTFRLTRILAELYYKRHLARGRLIESSGRWNFLSLSVRIESNRSRFLDPFLSKLVTFDHPKVYFHTQKKSLLVYVTFQEKCNNLKR